MPLGELALTFAGIALVAGVLPAPWRQRVANLLAIVTAGLALIATLNRPQEYLAAGWWPWEVWNVVSIGPLPLDARREQLNVLLLMPFTYFGTIALRRPARVAAASALLSCVIEYVQGAAGIGTAQLADLVHNIAGAVLGAVAASLLLSAVDQFRCRFVTGRRRAG